MRNAIQKLYYSITEISQMIAEEQHVLRYWEREFPQLRPQKNRAGNRVYTQRDLAILKVIKRLLRQERYTVAGAKEYLRQHSVLDMVDQDMLEHEELSDVSTEGTSVVQEAAVADTERKALEAKALVDELTTMAASLRRTASSM
jgi:DNA-binding transcriptional MerR regulator